ncbi:hypothetical protein ElyMa_001447600 [Elysia marginata]|uniref:Uncharacterized protein n=1 Tax=Elysia marginata TaxID=1093978 RepID=A0AAV4J1N8_9GAST|nr:hypothetical protein ElyMa_001447600 [Elysia marginata]
MIMLEALDGWLGVLRLGESKDGEESYGQLPHYAVCLKTQDPALGHRTQDPALGYRTQDPGPCSLTLVSSIGTGSVA